MLFRSVEIIRAHRATLELTQQALADLLQVSLESVTKWEHGKNPMPAPTFKLLELYATGAIQA